MTDIQKADCQDVANLLLCAERILNRLMESQPMPYKFAYAWDSVREARGIMKEVLKQ